MKQLIFRSLTTGVLCIIMMPGYVQAQNSSEENCDQVCQATRDAQDVTAAVNGVFFSNTIGVGPNSDNNLYDFQIQPIATVVQEEWGEVVLRGIVPVLGVPTPSSGGDLDTEFGVSDTVIQAFYVPRIDSSFKYGFGPQVSFDTHTEDETKAAGWGAGPVFGGFGFAGPLAFGGLLNHLWGEDDFSKTTIQPIVYYNLETPGIGAWFFGYNAQITYDWNADDDEWQVPLGLSVGKTFVLPSKHSITLTGGAYDLVEDAGTDNDYQIRFNVNVLFP